MTSLKENKENKENHFKDNLKKINGVFIFLSVIFLMVAAILTQFSQEDAYIYFRTARNIADAGDFSYNLGEGYPAATSYFYAHVLGLIFYYFGDFFYLVVNIFNCLLSVHAVYMLSKVAAIIVPYNHNARNIAFWTIATSPPLITLAISGMETALLLWAIALLVYSASKCRHYWILSSASLIPLVRPEAGIVPILVAVISFVTGRRFGAVGAAVGVFSGFILLIIGNYFLSGHILPQTMLAKNVSYQPPRDFLSVLMRVIDLLFNSNFLIGINTKYMPSFLYFIVGTIFVTFTFIFLFKLFLKLASASQDVPVSSMIFGVVVLVIYAFVIGYSIGGVIFPWYLWPSSVLFYFLVSVALASIQIESWLRAAIVALSILSVGNLVVLSNTGYKEVWYRAEIGRDIARRAEPSDTLFLEPAGYIPFYAGVRTWDTVGLVSPDILSFRNSENPDWWIDFVRATHPTWIVERSPIHISGFPDSTNEAGFSIEDRDYFTKNYDLIVHYSYTEFRSQNFGPLSGLYSLGSDSDYYLYRARNPGF